MRELVQADPHTAPFAAYGCPMDTGRVPPPSERANGFNGDVDDEADFREIDVAMLYIEEARSRAESGVAALRRANAEPHLVDAMERAQAELSDTARRLRQGTFFAVPRAQTTF